MTQNKNKVNTNDFLATRTLVWFERFNKNVEDECEFNNIWAVHFEKRKDISTNNKYEHFAVAEVSIRKILNTLNLNLLNTFR